MKINRDSLIVTVLVSMLLSILSLPVYAQSAPDKAASLLLNQLQGKLDALPASEDVDARALREIYQLTLKYVQEQQEYTGKAEQFNRLITDFTHRSDTQQQQIINYKQQPRQSLGKLNATQIEQQLAVTRAKLLDLRNEQNNLNNDLALISSRRLAIPELINRLKASQEQVIDKNTNEGVSGNELNSAKKSLNSAHLAALVAQVKMLELELLSSNNQQALLKQQLTLLDIKINDLTQLAMTLQDRLADIRREAAEKTVAETKKLSGITNDSHPLLQQQLKENQRLSARLTQLTEEVERSIAAKQANEKQSDLVSGKLKRVKKQLQWLEVSSAFGQTLRAELASLPSLPDLGALLQRQGELQFFTYDLEQEAELLGDPKAYVERLVADQQHDINAGEKESLISIIKARHSLVTNLLDSNRNLLAVLSQQEVVLQGLSQQIRQFKALIDRRLLWVPNTNPITIDRLPLLQHSLQWLLSPATLQQFPTALTQQPKLFAALLVFSCALAAVWAFSRRRLQQLRQRFSPLVGKVTQDRFINTLHLLIAGVIYALPLPVFCQLLGRLLLKANGFDFAQGLGQGLLWLSLPLWIWATLRNWSAPLGFLQAHLHWEERGVRQWMRQLRRLVWFSIPLILLISISEWVNTEAMRSTLGRTSFVIWCLGLSLFFLRALREPIVTNSATVSMQTSRLYRLARGVMGLTPLVFGALALYGYFYTGLMLLSSLLYSLLIGLGWFIVYCLAIRGLLVQERRFAFDQAKARRADIIAQRSREEESSGESALDLMDENQIDLKTISEQTRGLIKTLLWIALGVSLWGLWSPMFSALNVLDSITVWETALTLNGTEQLQPITLKAFLFAITIVLLMWISIRNLPGVMQLLVLQHLSLSPGTGYAITALLNYVLIIVGLLVSFNILGFDWEKMQWLVAALGVGLGFGLQEIFANFISGLIILFEKPIRIGDTVTINGLTGTVSKIQIRATTIVDWDRKEIIVPNKAFITEQLINWSLSDPITRLKIPVGVAYGSDNALVERLLLESAGDVPNVLMTPKPEAYFIGFGDSALNYELRIYVSEMADRLPVTHAIHNLIDSKFRRHDVEIAFPQLDITLKRGQKPNF